MRINVNNYEKNTLDGIVKQITTMKRLETMQEKWLSLLQI